jgi:putative hydrolase of the HAD superfamily
MLPPGTRTVLFDFDRTLGQYRSHYGIYVRAAAEFGVAITEDALASADLDDAWARWMTPRGPEHREESKSEEAFAEVRKTIAITRFRAAGVDVDEATLTAIAERIVTLEYAPEFFMLYDDTVPALDRLARAGVQSIIVSNHMWRLPEVIRALGVSSRFEGVITSARVGVRKPHPEIFEAALRLAATPVDQTIYVGDSYKHDVEGARGVGMASILIDRPSPDGATRYATAEVDVPVIKNLTELVP